MKFNLENTTVPTLDDDDTFDGNFEASPTSTPKKAKTNSTQRLQSKRKGSEVANHDETLQHLRTEKVKQSNRQAVEWEKEKQLPCVLKNIRSH